MQRWHGLLTDNSSDAEISKVDSYGDRVSIMVGMSMAGLTAWIVCDGAFDDPAVEQFGLHGLVRGAASHLLLAG